MMFARFLIAFSAQTAVIFGLDRPWPYEIIAGFAVYLAVYFGLDHLKRERV